MSYGFTTDVVWVVVRVKDLAFINCWRTRKGAYGYIRSLVIEAFIEGRDVDEMKVVRCQLLNG